MSSIWKNHLKKILLNPNELQLEEHLADCWAEIFPEDKTEIYRFLAFNGRHPTFLRLMVMDLKAQPNEAPWLLLFHLLEEQEIQISKDTIEKVRTLLSDFDLIANSADDSNSLLANLVNSRRSRFMHAVQLKKHELLTSARIAKSEGLVDQHLNYMDQLKKLFPSDYNLTNLISEQEINKAQSTLARRARKKVSSSPQTKSVEEIDIAKKIKDQSQRYLQEGRGLATDFAYLLRSTDNFEDAIEILESQGNQQDWHLLEYYYSGGQYLSTLNQCSKLKSKYQGIPDAQFSISYFEALSYWKLGEKDRALELMSQISTMRPQFKSATEILTHWKEESYE